MINTALILLVSNLIPATLVVTAKALEETNCEDDEFKCKNGYCYPKFLFCREEDETCDYSSSSVERICSVILEAECSIMHSHLCEDGTCIPTSEECNEVEDCNDASDKLNCRHEKKCSNNAFRCGDGKCIPERLVCNEKEDCNDASDELNCRHKRDLGRRGLGKHGIW